MCMSQTVRAIAAHSLRLDAFVATIDGVRSRVQAKSLIEGGHVSVSGKTLRKCSHMLSANDDVIVTFPAAPLSRERTSVDSTPLAVLFEDAACIIIDKPAGIVVHPGAGTREDEPTILDMVRPLFDERSLPYVPSHCLVHRLDKETSGCLIIAKSPDMHLALQRLFQTRAVAKTYLAVVFGTPSHQKALINAPIGRHVTRRTTMSVSSSASSREARTAYETLDASHEAALLSCDLQTGRTHQIRVHLSSIGHPVLGDQTYGHSLSSALSSKHGIRGLCLHAWKIQFTSPTHEQISVISHPPASFTRALKSLGMSTLR